MLTCRLCWLSEVGAAPCAMRRELCLQGIVLSSSWAMLSKCISVGNSFSLQPEAGQKYVSVFFVLVAGREGIGYP